MGGVAVGSPVSAANTNAAFLDANGDDTGIGIYTLANTAGASGPTVPNVQGELNGDATFIGRTVNSGPATLPGWTSNDVGISTDPLFDRLDKVSRKLGNPVSGTGHGHTGAAQDGPQLNYLTALSGTQLKAFAIQGTNLTAVTGTSTDVSTQLSTETPSSAITTEGIVVNAPYNLVQLFDTNDNAFEDASGNKVYGRLTNTGGVGGTWTLSYFSEISGVETAYTFASSTVKWFYQKLFNESNRPVYSDQFVLTSNLLAGEIPDATTTVKGKVLLASATPQPVSSSGFVGTSSKAAREDHVHATAGFTRETVLAFTLLDNQSTPQVIYTKSATGLSGVKFTYGIRRTTNSRHSDFWLSSDGTSTSYADGPGTELNSTGITLTADLSGGNFRLLYTSTNTGSNGTFNVEVLLIPS